ncbi:hypothetical protein [Streptomyces brasiliensis]|uniref:hypothetical protein n=1 Tax=Streptomyces brasiliensis TaxID=1954 RepID=UPI0016709807|nr:hypothetical protein [Streptomyces brasiliensis]
MTGFFVEGVFSVVLGLVAYRFQVGLPAAVPVAVRDRRRLGQRPELGVRGRST